MKTLSPRRASWLGTLFFVFIAFCSYGQLIVTGGLTAEHMAERLSGSGVTISNATLICPDVSSGAFSNGQTTNLGLRTGLMLTSGCITNALGPNSSSQISCPASNGAANLGPGDTDLTNLAGFRTNDACILEFDLESIGTEVTFRYVFASDEYPEYVCSRYNDIFAFFVSGPRPGGGTYNKENIAIVPGTTSLPVAINNVNPGVVGSRGNSANCGSLAHSDKYVNNTGSTIEYDGFTTVLTARIELVPCQTYRFRLGVADGFDKIYDSAVFLEEGSFVANLPLISDTEAVPTCPDACDGIIDIDVDNGTAPYTYSWSTGATTQDISGICAGSYTVTVVDAVGCRETKTINLPDGLDVVPPSLICPTNIDRVNDPGICGAKVDYLIGITDNCSDIGNIIIDNPAPSGSTFPVGVTLITIKATDEAGNSASCTFSVRIRDEEEPQLTCPDNITVSCEDSLDPADTGELEATDNCLIQSTTMADVSTPGICPQEKTIVRTWTVRDIHSNEASCSQTITVVDDTAPVITCPRDTVVACDTTTLSTGFAKAVDNCDPVVIITYTDKHTGGDCKWQCFIERTFTAVDDCNNTSACVQQIEINKLPLIEEALNMDLDEDGVADGLRMGTFSSTTLDIPPTAASCVLGWLPGSGSVPDALDRGNQTVGADCLPGTNAVDSLGQLENPLFAAGLHLAIVLRLHPEYGDVPLDSLDCEIAPIVDQFLGNNPTVGELMELTHKTLSNITLVPHRAELLEALLCVIEPTDPCEVKSD